MTRFTDVLIQWAEEEFKKQLKQAIEKHKLSLEHVKSNAKLNCRPSGDREVVLDGKKILYWRNPLKLRPLKSIEDVL